MHIWKVYADTFYLFDIHAWRNFALKKMFVLSQIVAKSADKEMLLPFKIYGTNLTLPDKNLET